jgi:hypothetical protein
MRVRRNWRLEFLIRHFRSSRGARDEERTVVVQRRPRNFTPEAPKIYSIGLHPSASIPDDPSNNAIRNVFKKRLNIIRR